METGCGAIPHYLALFGETLPHKVVAVVTGSDLSRITPRLRLPAIKKERKKPKKPKRAKTSTKKQEADQDIREEVRKNPVPAKTEMYKMLFDTDSE